MRRLTLLLALLLGLAATAASAQETTLVSEPDNLVDLEAPLTAEDIQIRSLNPDFELEYDLRTGMASAQHGVQVVFREATLTASRIQIDADLGQATAEGSVKLERAGQIWLGERLRYSFRTDAMEAEDFRLGVPPAFLGGERAITLEPVGPPKVYQLQNAYLTTDDLAEPGYRIRAREITIREDRRIVARSATLIVGETPVFWFPYFTRRIGPHPNRWTLTPGYRSTYGAYLRTTYEFEIATNAVAGFQLDGFTRRGIGVGPLLRYDLGPLGEGAVEGYWIADQKPGDDPETGEPIDDDRQRISFHHQVQLRPGLTGTAVVRQQSDRWVLRDFFEDEFRRNPLPDSFFEIQQAWPDFTLNTLARVQVNDTFETVERLPDVRLSAHRQELGHSGLFYEGENSLGWFRHRHAEPALTNDYSAFRADSLHQILLPKTFFGWLNVTPRVGGRLTYYGDTESDGWESLDAETRGVFNTGVDLSFKAHRVWSDARNRFWDVQGIRHILEPSIQYAYTPRPNARPLELPQFDTELPSLRLLPIHYPDYNSIDSIDSQNVLRLGMRNKLQTRRNGQSEDLLDWAIFTDWRLDPRSDQGTFNDVYSEADFKPRLWLTFNSEVRVDPNDGVLRESQTSAVLHPSTDWSFGVTHRYTRDDAFLGPGGDLLGTRVYLRFSENWGVRMSHYYEIEEGLLQEQYYTIYRDLRSLTAALTLRFRESIEEPDDFTIAVSISIKAFPRFRTGQDAVRPSLLIGG